MRIDLSTGEADILIDDREPAARRNALDDAGGYAFPESQTPWQEILRMIVGQFAEGMVLKPAQKYQKVAKTKGLPRDSH